MESGKTDAIKELKKKHSPALEAEKDLKKLWAQ